MYADVSCGGESDDAGPHDVLSAVVLRCRIHDKYVVVRLHQQGISAVTHAVVCHDEKNPDPKTLKLKLLVEGENLRGVMGTRGKLLFLHAHFM